jgi:hypothetical protein
MHAITVMTATIDECVSPNQSTGRPYERKETATSNKEMTDCAH